MLSSEQKTELDEKICQKYSLENYNFYYLGTYHDVILFNIDGMVSKEYIENDSYKLIIMSNKNPLYVLRYSYKVDCFYNGKLHSFIDENMIEYFNLNEKERFMSKYINFQDHFFEWEPYKLR